VVIFAEKLPPPSLRDGQSPAWQGGESPGFLLAQEPAGFLLRRNLSKSGWRYIAPCA